MPCLFLGVELDGRRTTTDCSERYAMEPDNVNTLGVVPAGLGPSTSCWAISAMPRIIFFARATPSAAPIG
jgi:hypothetical protein